MLCLQRRLYYTVLLSCICLIFEKGRKNSQTETPVQVFSSEIEETLQKLFHGTPLNICFSTLVLKNDNNTLLLIGRMVNLQE